MTFKEASHAMRSTSSLQLRYSLERIVPIVILTLYALLALFPIVMIIMNSFKARKAIFGAPFAFPTSETFSLIGYETVTERSTFHLYFLNSAIVTFVALVFTLFVGAMAAFALAEYDFPGNALAALSSTGTGVGTFTLQPGQYLLGSSVGQGRLSREQIQNRADFSPISRERNFIGLLGACDQIPASGHTPRRGLQGVV